MTPYVIDQKKRQEYFLFLILFTVISFALGYFFGYQNSQSDSNAVAIQSPVIEEAKPLKTAPSKENLEKKSIKNDIKVKNKIAVKDNTKKQVKKEVKKQVKNKIKDKPKTKSSEKSNSEKKVRKKIAASKPDKQQPKLVKTLKPDAKIPADSSGLQSASQQSAKNVAIPVDEGKPSTEQSSNKKVKSYSVQVGMFASKPNAEKFVNKLKFREFDVYLEDFISSTGQEKYNVRLGPFMKRAKAKDIMALYKQSYTTPAYIVINK